MTFTLAEKLLLALAILLSVGLFARDLRRKIAFITAGRGDRVRTDRPAARWLRVLKEVLFQSRVVGGRPVVGALHAIVFLGFAAFAFETLNHFLLGFGLPYLEPLLGAHGLEWFHTLLAVVAVGVSLAIAALAFRRFVLVKISPDPKSYTSGIVAALILLLMLTFLNGIREVPVWPKLNWWLHAAIILVFPHLILRSKHFHIFIAPVTIWFRTHRLGDFLPLELDEEKLAAAEEVTFGLESMKDAPWKMRMDFLSCVECRRCTDNCPANLAGQELDPRGFVLAGRRTLTEMAAETGFVGTVFTERALGQCTSCGACEAICPVGIEHLQVLLGSKRAQAMSIGKGMVAAKFLETVERYGNPFSAPPSQRATLVSELALPPYEPGKTEWLLWLGCVWGYNADARSSVAAMAQVLSAASVSYGVLEDEGCCGHHSRRQGEEMQFQTLAKQNLESLAAAGVAKIVTPCPHCFHTLRHEYEGLGVTFAPQVKHHSELLADLVKSGRLRLDPKRAASVGAVFHDPCYLGRYEGILAAPREVARASGLSLSELQRHGARSYCCGGGSAGFARESEETRRVDQVRKAEVAASGAKLLVTACPECKMMLTAATDETLDLVEVVARSLPAIPSS